MSRRKNRGLWGWRGKTALASLLLGGPLGLTWVLAAPQGAANLDQIRHGKFDAPISPANWVNGNAGFQNAHYLEGHSIAYRAILTDLPVGKEIRLIVEHDIKHSDTHALDYLTHFQRLEPHIGFGHPAEVIDPRIDVPEVAGSPIMGDDTTPIPAPSSAGSPVAGQPTQSYNDLIATFGADAVHMTIYNGSFTAPITYVAEGDLMASKASSSIEISFVADNATVVLAWGGHIASREDWGYDADGVPLSAGGISGSPYHMRLISWEDGDVTLTNLGNQDRSLKADAVFVPPSCSVNCDQAVCVGEDAAECCVEVTEGIEPYSFDWSGPGGFTSDQQCITITNAQLDDAGNYSVVVTDKIGLFSSEDCSFDLTVDENPTCEIGGAEIVCPDTLGELYCGTAGMKTYAWSASGNCSIPGATDGQCVNVDFTNAGSCDLGLDVTSNEDCPGNCSFSVTIAEKPVCDMSNAEVTAAGVITGGTVSGGTAPYACTASFDAASGWESAGCSVDGAGNITVLFNVDPATDLANATVTVTVTDANGCQTECVGNVTIAVGCTVDPAGPICLDDTETLVATVDTGLDGQTIEWFGPFDGTVDCSTQTLGTALKTCSGLNVGDTCTLDVTPASAGTFSWCSLNTEPNGFTSFCRGDLLVNPNPDCSIAADPEGPICDFGESAEFCAPAGMANYSWSTGEDTQCITVDTAGEYCVTIVDGNGCESTCCRTLEVENCRCRVTGGGNDGLMPPQSWADGDDGDNNWTFGGQAGAPSASSPAFGEWTHHQKSGSKGRFVFHAGTASAPPRTIVETIRCSDAENCSPARPAPSKQIDFSGVGSIKNGTLDGDNGVTYKKNNLLCFEVQIEDLGEPGNRNLTSFDDDQLCPLGGHPADGDCAKCDCADWYTIRIWDCGTGDTAYEVGGYIHGGNLQIHPLVGETYDGPSCGD